MSKEFEDEPSEEYLDGLLAGAMSGNRESLEELFSRERSLLRRRANLIASQSVSISAVVQEAILIAIVNLETLEKRTIAGFRGWLLAIFRNEVYRAYKNKKKGPEFIASSDAIVENWPDDSMTLEQQQECGALEAELHQRIDSLDTYQRQIIILRYFQSKSIKEIAELFGQTEVSIRSALTRAIKKLRFVFAEDSHEPD
jgi:RNA polymerase sigma-70 factor, ECF subfamily